MADNLAPAAHITRQSLLAAIDAARTANLSAQPQTDDTRRNVALLDSVLRDAYERARVGLSK